MVTAERCQSASVSKQVADSHFPRYIRIVHPKIVHQVYYPGVPRQSLFLYQHSQQSRSERLRVGRNREKRMFVHFTRFAKFTNTISLCKYDFVILQDCNRESRRTPVFNYLLYIPIEFFKIRDLCICG